MTFIDANVFLHIAGRDRALGDACLAAVLDAQDQPTGACTDAEVLQEVLHVCRRRGRADAGFQVFDTVVSLGFAVLPITAETMVLARELAEQLPELSTRDAVHAASMQLAHVQNLLSFDRGFDAIAGILRRTPHMPES